MSDQQQPYDAFMVKRLRRAEVAAERSREALEHLVDAIRLFRELDDGGEQEVADAQERAEALLRGGSL